MDSRRTFSREFKLAAVKKVIEQGLTYREVARELGIRDTYIHIGEKPLSKTARSRSSLRRAIPSRLN